MYDYRDEVKNLYEVCEEYELDNGVDYNTVSQLSYDEERYRAAEAQLKRDGVEEIDLEDIEHLMNCKHYEVFPANGMLADLLRIWFGAQGKKIEDAATCCTTTSDGEWYIWAHGGGYNVWDCDLFGGNGDGQARRAFERWVDNLENLVAESAAEFAGVA